MMFCRNCMSFYKMFCIDTGSLKLELEVVRVDSLFRHEEILPHVADKLIFEFKNWTNLQNPVIVDKNFIVLDGNHRVFVFNKLNFKYIPVCKVDYFNEATQLRYWFRLLRKIESIESLKQIINDMNGSFREVSDGKALRQALENNNLSCGIQQGNFYASISFHKDVVNDAVSAYNALERIQDKLLQNGLKMEYIPCQSVNETKFCDELKNSEIIIWTPQITKEMVVNAVKKKKIFAPKTTRHLIPARPLNMNVPTYWFKEDISLAEINKRFLKLLERKKLRRFSPGQVVDGRYYEEELFIFFD